MLIEAYDVKGHIVGEAKPGLWLTGDQNHNAKTRDTIPITLKMDMDFEEEICSVKALDPITQTALGKHLN